MSSSVIWKRLLLWFRICCLSKDPIPLAQCLPSLEIEFITFDDLIKNYEINSIDNLQIDVEGAEFHILNSIDFQKININSIQFESKHFDGTFSEGQKLKTIKEKLKTNGFQLTQIDKENILAKKNYLWFNWTTFLCWLPL